MRTPRDILLTRHQATDARLNVIRQSVVAAECSRTYPGASNSSPVVIMFLAFPGQLWHELILPSRRLWTGLAAIWIFILATNLAERNPVSSVTGLPVHAPAVTAGWTAQQRWMNEMFADRSAAPDADRPRTFSPKPRTEGTRPVPT